MIPASDNSQNEKRDPGLSQPDPYRFDYEMINAVWQKAKRQPGFETFGVDHRGTPINRFDYGKRSEYGWIIERIVPDAKEDIDEIDNLRPAHWKHSDSGKSSDTR